MIDCGNLDNQQCNQYRRKDRWPYYDELNNLNLIDLCFAFNSLKGIKFVPIFSDFLPLSCSCGTWVNNINDTNDTNYTRSMHTLLRILFTLKLKELKNPNVNKSI